MSEPPKRDKFASMAAAQKEREDSINNPTPILPPPKPDKFASMVAKQQGGGGGGVLVEQAVDETTSPAQGVSQPPVVELTAPKRDKFASMAARQQKQQQVLAGSIVPEPMTAPKKDLLSGSHDSPTTATAAPPQDRSKMLQARIQQRQKVLCDLELAEGLIWKLNILAKDTAHAFSDLSGNTGNISATSKDFRETLKKIHQTLHPHAHLVKAYQNHQVDKKEDLGAPNMYAARVEMRLAQEKQQVLAEMLQLEQGEDRILPVGIEPELTTESGLSNKRKRTD